MRYAINWKSKILRVIGLVLALAIVLSVAACVAAMQGIAGSVNTDTDASLEAGLENAPEVEQEADLETVAERLVAVNTAPVQTGDIHTELSFTGQVKASSQITVMSRLQGVVDEVMVNVGDFVSEGDILFTMDESDIQANVRTLNAQLSTADAAVRAAETGVSLATGSAVQGQILQTRGALTQAEAGVVQAEAGVVQAQAGVEQAEAGVEQRALGVRQAEIAYADARANFESMSILLEFGDISQVQFEQAASGANNAAIMLEQAKSAYEMANISLEQARNGVEQARKGVEIARSGAAHARESYRLVSQSVAGENRRRAQDGLAQAEAQRNVQAVNLEAARDRLDDTVITAPISGVISSRGVEARAMLLPNVAPITIVSIDEVIVHVNVTETIVNRIANGQRIIVNIPAASDVPFEGEVITVSPTVDPMTQTFVVEVSLENRDMLLRPGMFAEAFFIRYQATDTLIVPRGAVLMESGQAVAFVVEDGRAVRREVTVGIDSGPEIEILSGLNEGEELIVTGQTFVRDGVPVIVSENGGAAN